MKIKVKKFLKSYLVGLILGIIISGTISVIATTYFPSNQTTYDNTVTGLKSENVQDAIDELYGVCFPPLPAGEQIIEDAGLEKDPYEDRYFFVGADVNNYITFSGEIWRILSIEADGRIKIVKDSIIRSTVWDYSGGGNGNNNWARPSDLNTYLNETYKNTLSDKDKIATSTWNIGGVNYEDTNLSSSIVDEKSRTWNGDIALITASEYIRSNSNQGSCGNMNQVYSSTTCKNTTWLYINTGWWTLSPYSATNYNVLLISDNGAFRYHRANIQQDIRPSLYLSPDIIITGGDGSQNNPYTIG